MINHIQNEELLHKINVDLKGAYKAEEEFWKQRSRQLWLYLGDKNIGFFHATTKNRKALNKFSVIENDEGQACFEEDKIVKAIAEYFQALFISQDSSIQKIESIVQDALHPIISAETNQKLFNLQQIWKSEKLCFINADNAPGPDGFSASFFQSNWEVVGHDIVKEVQEFFQSGCIPRTINETHIRLPKVTGPKKDI